ncbi:hypothetical protein SAMN05421670_2920 [Psychrobacillus psychrotolerans]|uniref:Uncharacterized protein n=1 Tax=Psychrobacillus psychrotolerans TaxID=126156 RepID=A0A1I5ZWE8_9BACI|nr:hypothetical protein [Psychrobacillus psychrotolerans]SFQ60597.1 hypothetical protein SAMN05421670_2920 [Psychrobacillus psychrotolerans]
MFSFLNIAKLKKDDLKGIAKLMYRDVSDDSWDKENLTKRNLDFTIESIRYIDMYAKRLINTDFGTELLNKHFDNFVVRIGAYIGEVIKNYINQDFYWYESDSVRNYSPSLDEELSDSKTQSVLYSKKRDMVILPLNVVSQFLKGNSPYNDLLTYVEEVIKQNT